MDKKYANFRSAKIVEVLKIEVNEGEGTHKDPVRRVIYLLDKKGKLITKINEDINREFAGEDELMEL
jgi:DnaJ-domain-containing protein 1